MYDRSSNGVKGSVTACLRLLCLIGRDPAGFKIESNVLKDIITKLDLPKTYPADSVAVRKDGRQYVVDIRARPSSLGRNSMRRYDV